jgi:hypothetical protein
MTETDERNCVKFGMEEKCDVSNAVFCVMTPYFSLTDDYQRLGETYLFHLQDRIITCIQNAHCEAARLCRYISKLNGT